ncbi:MAG: hypothetical protein JRM80_01270 [Nitrososphaerota archaeon]|nr:hypothetical protein [Nitrososphaerota archaeon]
MRPRARDNTRLAAVKGEWLSVLLSHCVSKLQTAKEVPRTSEMKRGGLVPRLPTTKSGSWFGDQSP